MATSRLPSERVRAEWGRRVEAEYRSAAIAQHLTLWLIQIGSSPDLIERGLRVVSDELAHARLSYEVFRAAGGEGPPALDQAGLGLARRDAVPLVHDVLRACLSTFCLHETVAVPLFRELRASCTVPRARRVLDRVLVDEVRHRDFGWALLTALLTDAPELRAIAVDELPDLLLDLESSYAAADTSAEAEIDPGDARWGLMPGARYAAILARTIERDYVPRFGRLGIDAREAWAKRT